MARDNGIGPTNSRQPRTNAAWELRDIARPKCGMTQAFQQGKLLRKRQMC